MAFRTSRTSTVRGRPPRFAGRINGATSNHSASVRSLSYRRPRRSAAARWSGFHMRHLSPTQVPHKKSQPIPETQLLSGWALRTSSRPEKTASGAQERIITLHGNPKQTQTLRSPSPRPCVAPLCSTVELSQLGCEADASGWKRLAVRRHGSFNSAEGERLTGYRVGGASPFGLKKQARLRPLPAPASGLRRLKGERAAGRAHPACRSRQEARLCSPTSSPRHSRAPCRPPQLSDLVLLSYSLLISVVLRS